MLAMAVKTTVVTASVAVTVAETVAETEIEDRTITVEVIVAVANRKKCRFYDFNRRKKKIVLISHLEESSQFRFSVRYVRSVRTARVF